MPFTRKVELGFFFLLAAAAAVVSFFIFKPYLGALFAALVFSIAFRPVHEFFLRIKMRESIAAIATLLFLLLVVLIPATLFGFFIFDDAQNLLTQERAGAPLLERLDTLSLPFQERLQGFFPDVRLSLSSYLREGLSFLVGNLGSVFSKTVGLVFKTFIMLLALFYLFRDGKRLRLFAVRLSPLTNEYDERILKRLEEAIASVVKGKLLIVFIQGVLAAIGFALFSVPHPVLWGAVTALAALIPAVGVALVFVPVVIYLFFTAGFALAAGALIFGIGVGMVDNFLGPIFYERGLRLHPLLILLSVLGGLALFGPVGFLAGPVTLALFFALLDIYPLLFESSKQ
jgi:predicted PurR-regulated permease PerM